MPSETASFGGLFMSLFAFAPFLLRLEPPAVIRCLRPVQLPFLVSSHGWQGILMLALYTVYVVILVTQYGV